MTCFSITVQKIIEIHDEILRISSAEEDRGMNGIRDEGTLPYIVEKLERDKEIGCDVIKSAAWVLYSITTTHPFFQANKRTAIVTAENILRHDGLRFNVDYEEGERFIIDVARYEYTLERVEIWIRSHIVKNDTTSVC
jgi:death on curing protein